MGVVVARPRRREHRSFGRRKHAGEVCSIITGMVTFKEGTLHQVSLGRGLALNGLPPLHVYVSQSAAALGGSTMWTRMLSQEEAKTFPATMPELPRSLSNIVDRISSYKDNRKLPTKKGTQKDSKPTQDPQEKCPQKA